MTRTGLDAMLEADSIAIVGASDRAVYSKVVFENLRRAGYDGRVHLVNPGRTELWGQVCHPSLSAIEDSVETIAVSVPSPAVPGVLREAVTLDIPSGVVYASGIGAEDEDSRRVMAECRAAVASSPIVLAGPNCMGTISARRRLVTFSDDVDVAADLAPVALLGQSGGVVLYLERALAGRGINAAYTITTGSEFWVGSADYIRHFARTGVVRVAVVFIEGISDPGAFTAACDEFTAQGGVVIAFKAGSTSAGREAALTHSGALIGDYAAFAALCEHHGVVLASSLEEVVELVQFFAVSPVPNGARAAALMYSGGLRGMLLDATTRAGMAFPELSDAGHARLDEVLPMGGHVANPLDVGFLGLSSAEVYEQCVRILLDERVDVLFAQENLPRDDRDRRSVEYIALLRRLSDETGIPIATFSMVKHGVTDFGLRFRKELGGFPALQGVDAPVSVLRAVAVRARGVPTPSAPIRSDERGAAIAERLAAAARGALLDEAASKSLLKEWGLPGVTDTFAADEAGVVDAWLAAGAAVAVKGVTADSAHKSELGLVELRIATERAARDAVAAIRTRAEEHGVRLRGFLVAPMVTDAVEVILSTMHDRESGPIIVLGAGGILTELIGDVSVDTIEGFTADRARALVGRTRIAPMLRGFRGALPADVDALVEVMVSLAAFSEASGGVADTVELNPVAVLPVGSGVRVLDAVIHTRAEQR